MRFTSHSGAFMTHVGTVADEDPPDPPEPPDTTEVVVMEGLTFLEYDDFDALVTIVGTLGDTVMITLGATVTDLTVAITITPTDLDGVEINWGDSSPVEYSPPATSHTYAAAGTYTISADPFGQGTGTTKSVTVTAPVTPEPPPVEPEPEPEPDDEPVDEE